MFKKVLTLVCAGMLGVSAAYAVPADPRPFTVTQPDGTTLTIRIVGDEFFHCLMTEDGYLVKKASDGGYNYIDDNGEVMSLRAANAADRSESVKTALLALNPAQTFSELKASTLATSKMWNTQKAQRMAAPQRANGDEYDNSDGHDIRVFPTSGEQNVLVVCVNFSDLKFSFDPDPHSAMTRMMNEVGYSEYGASGSSYDFYYASSAGQFLPKFDVYGPITLPSSYSYYGADRGSEIDFRAAEMIRDAINILDPDVDFTQYDRNGDGYVDNVYVFYAGYGQADTGMENVIWPHAFQLQYALGAPIEVDGVKVDKYATSNEINRDDSFDGIGTFCHEFAHVLGLPDLYETSYSSGAFTPGEYSAMDSGPYNGDGYVPPIFSAYERYALEWLNPVVIDQSMTINMAPLTRANVAYKIPASSKNPKEYFLFENRQQESWDSYIPGHGMLVWHIDFDSNKWFYNTVNNSATHQCVDIEEADNALTAQTRSGDTFPGTSNIFEFTGKSRPAFRNWANEIIDYPITEISESVDGVISMKVNGGGDENSPMYVASPKAKATVIESDKFTLQWDAVAGADGYMLTVYAFEDSDGAELYGHVADYLTKDLGNITSIEITDLDSEQAYVARLYAYNRYNMSAAQEINISTISDDMTESAPMINVGKVETNAAELWWTALPDAEYYELTVATRTVGESNESEIASFDGKKLPSSQWYSFGGWETRTGYFGESAPSLKLSAVGDLIETPVYDKDIRTVNLWTRLSRENVSARLEVYGSDGVSKYHIATITEIDGTEEGTNLVIDRIPYGTRQVSLNYYYASKDAILYIDDIQVNFAGEITDVAIDGYDGIRVDGTSHKVTGLAENTDYVAYVKAFGNGEESKVSRALGFTTADPLSVDAVTSENRLAVTVDNGLVRLSDATQSFNIYTVDGRVVALNVVGQYQLPQAGLYIVKAGSKVAKVNW